MAGTNQFCLPDPINNPKWTMFQAAMWKVTPDWKWLGNYGGSEQLWAYKKGWVSYNRLRIISIANSQQIPADFLGCVIFNEVGGDPPWFKHSVVLPVRQYVGGTKNPMATSEGAIKIQLQAALAALGYKGDPLTRKQQNDLTACLETDIFNIDAVARFLRQMILFDYPKINTRVLTDEQFAVAGSRYNRGTARPLKEFQDSLHSAQGTPKRVYSSYGRAMLRHRLEVRRLLGI